VRIYNDKYDPVFINQNSFQWPRNIIDKVKDRKILYYADGKTQVAGIYYNDNSGDFTVIISAVDNYGYKRMNDLRWSMALTFFVSVILMFFLGRLFARIALSPITKVINEVKIIRATSLDKRLKAKESKDEINELVITFNNLLEHLEQSFEAQRAFVTNSSHELRTPLTSIMGDIEVTLVFDREKDEYKKTLQRVLGETEKLNELINSLFELAQANIDVNDFEEVRLDELMWQVKDEWSNKIPGSQIELVYNLPPDPKKFTIQGNRYLLFIALGNIVKNAIKFSDNKAVTCAVYYQNDSTIISVRDMGIGVASEDIQKIFQPFYRGANSSGYTGLGIGLSLSEKIFRLHDITIKVNPECTEGSEFLITSTVK
jgi:signal transduction histidine kinase